MTLCNPNQIRRNVLVYDLLNYFCLCFDFVLTVIIYCKEL